EREAECRIPHKVVGKEPKNEGHVNQNADDGTCVEADLEFDASREVVPPRKNLSPSVDTDPRSVNCIAQAVRDNPEFVNGKDRECQRIDILSTKRIGNATNIAVSRHTTDEVHQFRPRKSRVEHDALSDL